jgi:hypothetical protein
MRQMTRPLAASGLVFLLAIAGGVRAQAPSPHGTQAPPRTQDSAKSPAQQTPPDRPLPDPKAFLAQAMRHLRSNDLLRSQYTYQEKEARRSYDSAGRATKTQLRVYEVHPSPEPELTYRRLVSENGVQPTDMAKRDADQGRKEREWLARRQREGLNAREARLRKEAEEDRKEQAVVDELTSIYDVRMSGRDTVDGRAAIVFALEPRPGYSPRTPQGKILKSFRGRAWVDEQEYELVRLKTDVLETVGVRFSFIVRLLKGSQGHIERRKVDGETWLPVYSRFKGSGRVFFVVRIDLDQESGFSSYKKKDGGE